MPHPIHLGQNLHELCRTAPPRTERSLFFEPLSFELLPNPIPLKISLPQYNRIILQQKGESIITSKRSIFGWRLANWPLEIGWLYTWPSSDRVSLHPEASTQRFGVSEKANSEKPRAVTYAEWALWLWVVFTCLLGIYQTHGQIPEIEEVMTGTLQGAITLSPASLMTMAVVGYSFVALLAAWIVYKIGDGKHWARSSLLWGFAFEILCMAFPPYHAGELLTAIPDLGLQIFAIYLLYTLPGSAWFEPKPTGRPL